MRRARAAQRAAETAQDGGDADALRNQLRELNDRLRRMEDRLNQGQPRPSIVPGPPPTPAPRGQAQTSARVTVKLPADARLWVDNVECPLTSGVRSFDTPALEPGATYVYTVRAQVNRDGQPRSETRRVSMTAGDRVTVSFTELGATATARR